jgi:hypothetical protein
VTYFSSHPFPSIIALHLLCDRRFPEVNTITRGQTSRGKVIERMEEMEMDNYSGEGRDRKEEREGCVWLSQYRYPCQQKVHQTQPRLQSLRRRQQQRLL